MPTNQEILDNYKKIIIKGLAPFVPTGISAAITKSTQFVFDNSTAFFLYVAYATDNVGTGFSLTATDLLKYRAEIHTTAELDPPTLADFAGATWVKYIGDEGAPGLNGVGVPVDVELTEGSVNAAQSGATYAAINESTKYLDPVLITKLTDFPEEYVYINNTLILSSNWRSVEIIVTENDIVFYSVHSVNTAHLVTFLDVSNNIIDRVFSSTSATTADTQTGKTTAPTNSVKAIVSTNNTYINDSFYALNLSEIVDRLRTLELTIGEGKTIIIDKNLTEDAGSYIFNTVAAGLAVADGVDTMKIYGDESSPYLEQGMEVVDGLTIIGVGKPWIKGELAASATTAEIDATSTFDAFNSVTLENLIISAKNMRYPIHADFSGGNTLKTVKNCSFIHYGNTEAWQYRTNNNILTPDSPSELFRAMSAWGGGTKAGDRVYIDGCRFESGMRAFSTHNNVNFELNYGASIVKVSNSECISHGIDFDGSALSLLVPLHVQNLDSNTQDLLIMDNVLINGFINNQVSGAGISHKVIINSNNLKQTWSYAGASKVMTDRWDTLNVAWYPIMKNEMRAYKNVGASTILRGKAVKLSGLGFDLYTSSDALSDFYGILMDICEAGQSAYVKYSGFLPWKYFDNPNFAITEGADVSVDSVGNFIQNSTHVVCNAVDNYNVLIN